VNELPEVLKVLMLEDVAADAELSLRELRSAGLRCEARRVESEEAFRSELEAFDPHVVLSDFSLPHFDGASALKLAQRVKPHTPFIFVSGSIGEDTAVQALRLGATDYVLKTNLVRLPSAVARAVEEAGERAARALAEEALRLSERAVEVSVNPIIITGDAFKGYRIVYVNPAFERVTGYKQLEVIGRDCSFLQGHDREQPELPRLREALDKGRDIQVVLRNYRKDGSLFWNDLYVTPVRDPASGQITHFVGVQHDITETKRYQEQLERQANHDELTGLANRSLLNDRLEQALATAQRYGRVVMVALADLDNFKLINDTLGHSIGDRLLQLVAERLLTCVRRGDTVARLGGDEFVLVLADQMHEAHGHDAVERVQRAIAETFHVGGHELRVSCSIGVSVYPDDGGDGETLTRLADVAMYRAKELGRSGYQFYTQEMTARIRERVALEHGLRQAVERGEFSLHYQPQFAIAGRKVIGMEALIRWQHPQLGLVSPSKFIPLAEETGLIVPIGNWVLREACMELIRMHAAGHEGLVVAVNLSARQLRQKDLVACVSAIIDETGMNPHCLELEITESMVMHNVEEVLVILAQLEEMGIKLSVDDFGTGYSSLSYLKRFPVHQLKIDRSFVRDIGTDADDTAIAQSIIALGHALDLVVLAEGVETEQQLEFLRQTGCDYAQGYLLCRPLPVEGLRAFMAGLAQQQPGAPSPSARA
jgi:diguanylate cyclase (GGDEF)-like protein/PAS domain S-box-containing protein